MHKTRRGQINALLFLSISNLVLYNFDTKYLSDERRLFMTCGNPIKHKFQQVLDNWLDMFSVERKLSDEQMECMQFGICDYVPRQVEEVPFFHY